MGKKKDKKRAREAAAAAAAAQNRTSEATPAMNGLSQEVHPMAPFSDPVKDHHQGPPSGSINPSWPAMNAAMALSGAANGPSYLMPQMMNGLQNFGMPMLQPNPFQNQHFINMNGMGMMMGMPFSTMQPNMFPGQHPAPALALYDLVQRGIDASGHAPLHAEDLGSTNPPRRSHRVLAAAANATTSNASLEAPQTASPRSNSKNGRAAITAPSAASGGVPDPTPLYLARASFLPKRRPEPGPLLVVIDLNGTLLHRPDRRKPHNFRRRPHADKFVSYCIETFWVVIWSSARPDNVNRMVETLVNPEQLHKVVAVWGRDRFGLTREDYNARTQCYKRLTTLWDDPVVKSSFPSDRRGYEGKCWDQGNTVLIDDSVEKARSEPHNAITIPEFTGDLDETLDILPKVHDYLNELCFQEDVSTYVRVNPFKMA
ncbi:hypothetical protein N8I77_009132 [Diaporthe amygdali]|uniref:Mitochondrial import inner membrane translocase subunit TIM50 n=1 Tax=Phomopsis amygdali TaxID=1214568 RepID=A0AAD9W252_PHOAM|nr:hypothetical protein N8I77_009132 [Diaporthe amygdali]